MIKDSRGNELEDQEMYLITVGTRLLLGRFCQKGLGQPYSKSYFEAKDSIIFVEEASKIERVLSSVPLNSSIKNVLPAKP